MSDDLWIVIPNWDKFQHYRDRGPVWIKVYTELVHRDDYLELPPTSRALLHGIWALYALSNGVLRAVKVPVDLRLRVDQSHWDSLSNAGFIQFVASKPLALRALAREEKRREEKPGRAQARKPTPKPAVEARINAGAYQPGEAHHVPDVTVDEHMLELAKGWLNP